MGVTCDTSTIGMTTQSAMDSYINYEFSNIGMNARYSQDSDKTNFSTLQHSSGHLLIYGAEMEAHEMQEAREDRRSQYAPDTGRIPSEQLRTENNSRTTVGEGQDLDVEKAEEVNDKPAEVAQKDPNIVEWDGPDDPENPMNFPRWRKWLITFMFGIMTIVVTFASSVFSTATIATAIEFNVSTEVTTLGTSLFVLGFAFGPIIWGPASELFGRKRPLFIGYFAFALLNIPVAVAQNLQTIMLTRFIGGAFAAAPLAIVGGSLADFFGPVDRGVAAAVFAGATFIGPITGPIVGGFITQSYLGWRWTAYITAIMGFTFGIIGFFIIPETHSGCILQKRAKTLKYQTKNWALHAKVDEREVDFHDLVFVCFLRPFHMLFREPILFLITVYMSIIYGILYLFFEAYPISFQEKRGWNGGVGALPFIGIGVGVLLGCFTIVYMTKTRFARKLKKHGLIPEERLPAMMAGAVILPAGLFWFAWTSSVEISWVPQAIAGVPIGMGILMIFLQGLNYIIDVYLMNANSAIAANTFLRSFAGAGFPLFASYMYNSLGVNWATSTLGFACAALVPVPFAFFHWGAKLRSMSKFSPY